MRTAEKNSTPTSPGMAAYGRQMGFGSKQRSKAVMPNTPSVDIPRYYGDAAQAFYDAARTAKSMGARAPMYTALRLALVSDIDRAAALLRSEFDPRAVEAAMDGIAHELYFMRTPK